VVFGVVGRSDLSDATVITAPIFERLRKPAAFAQPKAAPSNLVFKLGFADQRAYVAVLDARGASVFDVDCRHFDGPLRQAVKRIESLRSWEQSRINWQSAPMDGVWLDEDDALIGCLAASGRFVDERHRPIKTMEGMGHVGLAVEASGETLVCQPVATFPDGKTREVGKLLSSEWTLIGQTALQVHPVGERYPDVALFQTQIKRGDLTLCLSLFCSLFDNIRIHYQDYAHVECPPVNPRPTLVFEKIGRDGALYLSAGVSTPQLPPQFFADYDITRMACVDDSGRRITVHEIVPFDPAAAMLALRQRLLRLGRRLPSREDACFSQDNNLLILEKNLAMALLLHELGSVMDHFAVLGSKNLAGYGVHIRNPALLLRLSEGSDPLVGTADLDFGEGATMPLGDALVQYRERGYVTLGDGPKYLVSQDYLEKLARLFISVDQRRVAMSFFDAPALEALCQVSPTGPAIEKAREVFRGFGQLDALSFPPPRLNATLRPYQAHGCRWLQYLHQHKLGGCLADDMGLGKTIQALAMLSSIYPEERRPSLIVMPAMLLENWRREIQAFAPNLRADLYHGPERDVADIKDRRLILTTYNTVRLDISALEQRTFHYVILDESQAIKNLAARSTKAILRLKAQRRLALSGTPVENNLGDLYSLFHFLIPGMLGSRATFNQQFADPIQRQGDKEAAAALRRKIHPFVLRRMKDDVLAELPEKTEQTLYVAMSPAQRRLYDERRAFFQAALARARRSGSRRQRGLLIAKALETLRQVASMPESQSEGLAPSAKRRVLMARLTEAVANGHKALVFSNFRSPLEWIGKDLEKAGISFLTMTGATRGRGRLMRRFQTDLTINVFLMTLKTGGVGLNLTDANDVFLFDPWWNRAAERQAVDRAHRIGQKRPVFVYRLITRDSVEEKIEALQERKQTMIDAVMPSDDVFGKSLSEEDIAFLFSA